jgi:hypothetical protein
VQSAAIRTDHVEPEIASTYPSLPDERDPPLTGRPGRRLFRCLAGRERMGVRPVAVHDVDVLASVRCTIAADEGDLPAVPGNRPARGCRAFPFAARPHIGAICAHREEPPVEAFAVPAHEDDPPTACIESWALLRSRHSRSSRRGLQRRERREPVAGDSHASQGSNTRRPIRDL